MLHKSIFHVDHKLYIKVIIISPTRRPEKHNYHFKNHFAVHFPPFSIFKTINHLSREPNGRQNGPSMDFVCPPPANVFLNGLMNV